MKSKTTVSYDGEEYIVEGHRKIYGSKQAAQLCPTLCDPMDCRLVGSSVTGILQARILEWVAMPTSGDLPNPEITPRSPTLQANSLPSEPRGKPKKSTGVQFML